MNHAKLLEQLKSHYPSDVIAALKGLSKIGNMHDISLTIGMIRNSNSQISRTAIMATDTLIRDAIVSNYHQLGAEGRQKLAEIIEKINPATIHDLIREIQSSNDDNKVHGLMILGVLRNRPEVRHMIESLMQSNNERVRATATQAMSNFPEKGEQILLLKKLNDPDERVRANAVEALGECGDRKMIFSIKRLLNDANNRVRANAIKSLYQLGDNRIENELVFMLTDREPMMIASGLWLINELGVMSSEIKESCTLLIHHKNEVVQRNLELVMNQFSEVEYAIRGAVEAERKAKFIEENTMVGGATRPNKIISQ